jgi:hypothetical protein
MTKSKGLTGGKGGGEQSRLSSDERARLDGSQAAEASNVGSDRVNVVAVEASCGIHRRPLLLIIERKDEATWRVVRAHPLPDTRDVVHTHTPAVLEHIVGSLASVHLEGKITIASQYAGCPYCLEDSVFRCGCGALNCQGATRRHEKHKDVLCGRCNPNAPSGRVTQACKAELLCHAAQEDDVFERFRQRS